ncbi:hypothetical protein F6R98_14520 [Candidatus Methylospira mobilis]|uniref:Small secreted protein n=1 Tax=Candidatus Methylospira mobilis TaxID=1808979 RepID=A0A5Q0BJF4_9GAMM|nr:small metal-binding protein SmbP [Candidatus Methylospira mobilis]QFY43689.1 hypothetical protein F6R98_14520 [Candidatus Methylospira mobilis]WNV04679.1 hypothetical protein RP726_20160 [Candidatus Methylospira mobilis]
MKHSKTLGGLILGGVLALGGSVAFAAENTEGVLEHLNLTVTTTKEALAAAQAGNKEGCLSAIKAAKQHYKELTGAPSGKPAQDAMKLVREGQNACEAGDTAKAVDPLSKAVTGFEKINAEAHAK